MAAADSVEESQSLVDDSSLCEASELNLKTLVADDTYEKLKLSFLPQKRGAPPRPPAVQCTNRLLLQLVVLHDESNKTWKDVGSWFCKLFPSVCYPVSRLSGSLNHLKKVAVKMHSAGVDLTDFLETEVDYDFISPSLTSLGLERGQLTGEQPPLGPFLSSQVTHQVIADLENFRSKERLRDTFTVQWIKILTGTSAAEKDIKYSIKKSLERYKKMSMNKGRDDQGMFSVHMASSFQIIQPPVKSAKPSVPCSTISKSEQVLQKTTKEKLLLQEQIKSKEEDILVLRETVKELGQEKQILQKIGIENQKLQEDLAKLQDKVKRQQQLLKDLKPNSDRLRYLTKTNIQLRGQVRSAKGKDETLKKLKQENKELKRTIQTNQETHQRQMRRQRAKLNKIQAEIEKQPVLILLLSSPTAEQMRPNLRAPVKNCFADSVRKTVMQLQSDCNVSAGKCSAVIKVIAQNLFGVEYKDDDLPSLQTAINISDEGHVPTKMQVAEKLVQTNNLTLHTDGTSTIL